jgi:uncharacterized protein
MRESAASPVVYVQVMQALVARELVEGLGLPERRAAELLGIVASSVSQYLSGKRLGPTLSAYLEDDRAREIARTAADKLRGGTAGPTAVLEAAIALGERAGAGRRSPRAAAGGLPGPIRRKVPGWLRQRIVGEQNAVTECMRLAQRSRDELTRALFRQIASDSLRHAEIVAALAGYLDRGVASSAPSGVTREDVGHLIRREHEAEASAETDLGPSLGGMMRILWDSMESDEKKHERLLQMLLDADLADGPRAARPRRRRVGARPR